MPTLPRARLSRPCALALSTVGALGVAASFWIPSLRAAHGYFPAPLDDVYIHLDFARALASGHPFEWIAGQGYSSGETAPLYAIVLALGWALGFRGKAAGLWGAVIAVLCMASLARSTRRLVGGRSRALAWMLAFLPLGVAVVDWTLVSGMEMALFAGVLGRALEALASTRAGPHARGQTLRATLQWRLGWWGAALCWIRPESAILVGLFGVLAARGARRHSGVAALARASLPGALATASILVLNRSFTGSSQSAGALLKLLSSNPYLSDEDRARAFVENLVTFFVKVIRSELPGGRATFWVVPALIVPALVDRRCRTVASACSLGALGWTLLVSWNGNSPFHNFRYYVPALLMLLVGASLGLASLAAWLPRRAGSLVAGALVVGLFAGAAPRFPAQVRHFRRAAANIRDQQLETGERLAKLLGPRDRVLLGDAGAIPFVSGRSAIDALGLGGFRRMPFAQAAVHGEAATVELLERLVPAERPTHLALYPNWFSLITGRFGRELDRVTIDDNVICGGSAKVIYRADWSALDDGSRAPDAFDELDVADVVSEAEHAYRAPLPHGGFTTLEVLHDGRRDRFDGGRIVPEGLRERFVVRSAPAGTPVTLVMRVDHDARDLEVRVNQTAHAMVLEAPRAGTWRHGRASLEPLRAGDVIELVALHAYHNYHVWLVRR